MIERYQIQWEWRIEQEGDKFFLYERMVGGIGHTRYGPMESLEVAQTLRSERRKELSEFVAETMRRFSH